MITLFLIYRDYPFSMTEINRHHILLCICTITLVLTSACARAGNEPATGPSTDVAHQVKSRIKPMVETLYLNVRELKEIYRDLRSVAQAHAIRGDDLQLNYIQKVALYIQKAHMGAKHQWEFLSLMDDIRSAALMDYYTLRHRGLQKAAQEALYDERFITIYQSQITHPAAIGDIDHALEIIKANRDIFNELATAIAPLVHQHNSKGRV